jgi:hypothetical protein
MQFAFNFSVEDADNQPVQQDAQTLTENHGAPVNHSSACTSNNNSKNNNSFVWIDDIQGVMECCLSQSDDELVNESVVLGRRVSTAATFHVEGAAATDTLRRVREDSISSLSASRYGTTDLVPGVYEGGLKVWECSLDLCRYLHGHDVYLDGYVLELGCGHGLPGCWVLQRALSARLDRDVSSYHCHIVFSDYNEFVLKDVTIKNVVLNAMDVGMPSMNHDELKFWLDNHTAFGAGDWNCLSTQLQSRQGGGDQSNRMPLALPKDGYFDCILAAETTYSEKAAVETAQFLSKHLTPGTGIAYIATKRYYFGVGGGTSCFCDALLHNRQTEDSQFHVETLEVYDDGVSNIRELLLVKRLS